ncbi:MAG: protein-disulfide reductase DsbD family protein, partial [Saprospiraceae bacterium]
PITGYLTFMTCDDEKCLPPTDIDFSFQLENKMAAAVAETPVVDETKTEPEIVEKVEKIIKEEPKLDKGTFADVANKAKEETTKLADNQEVKEEVEASEETAATEPSAAIPVNWNFAVKEMGNNQYEFTATANLGKGWAIYSQHTDDGGPIPTEFFFTKNDNFKLVGETSEAGNKKEGMDDLFGVNVIKFVKEPVVFKQLIEVTDPAQNIEGYISYMVCDDEGCTPADVDFTISPAANKAFDPNATGAVAANDTDDKQSNGVFNKENIDSDCNDATQDEEEDAGLPLIFLLGFGGGLLALLTPCVFPMIPLTVGFFTKSSVDKASGLRNALIYGASIIVIYVTLGLLITGIFGADALNLLSTNFWFNLFFGILFIVFAFSFFGFFEITLPSSWANKSDAMADKGGLIGIFFMAFTLSLVSFSCTGPIIGTLLVETATGGGPTILGRIPVGPLVGMFGFSVALALPFALFAMFPSWLNSLPRSGSWMDIVKVTLGFIELALAIKFFSIADLTENTKWMPYELFVGIWVLCALGLAAYYFGWLKMPHSYPGQKISNVRKAFGVGTLALGLYLASGFMVDEQAGTFATPNLLSGLAPPAGHSYIYPNKCPLNINCFKDYEEGLSYAKKVGKPILLDFTGHGCVNCRRMEDQVWGEDGVYELISDEYVLVSLYVDDRKKLDEPYVSDFDGKKKRTIGNKWADFQAKHFDKNSQPYYVLVSEDGTVLNKPRAYTPDKEEYQNFLECGLERYQEMKQLGQK